MNKSAVVHAGIERQTKKKAERGLIPNELTTKTLQESHKGEDVETFETLEKMFESWRDKELCH